MFSVFIDLKGNMFRDCVEENSLYTVLIDINADVSVHESGSVNKRPEDGSSN